MKTCHVCAQEVFQGECLCRLPARHVCMYSCHHSICEQHAHTHITRRRTFAHDRCVIQIYILANIPIFVVATTRISLQHREHGPLRSEPGPGRPSLYTPGLTGDIEPDVNSQKNGAEGSGRNWMLGGDDPDDMEDSALYVVCMYACMYVCVCVCV
jgi:hypothetical protein